MKRLLLVAFIFLANNEVQAQKMKQVPNLKLGYTRANQVGYFVRHIAELGYYYSFDSGIFSHGPSFSGLVVKEGKTTFVCPKLSYEACLLFAGAKMDLWFYNGHYFLSPSAGISFLGFGNAHIGYNKCLNEPLKDGVFLAFILNIPFKERPTL